MDMAILKRKNIKLSSIQEVKYYLEFYNASEIATRDLHERSFSGKLF